jgi:uncharacterized protein YegP (UPF0339 family)
MAGKFVLKKTVAGKYHFVLKAGNGEIIATSERHEQGSRQERIGSVKENAKAATVADETGE